MDLSNLHSQFLSSAYESFSSSINREHSNICISLVFIYFHWSQRNKLVSLSRKEGMIKAIAMFSQEKMAKSIEI